MFDKMVYKIISKIPLKIRFPVILTGAVTAYCGIHVVADLYLSGKDMADNDVIAKVIAGPIVAIWIIIKETVSGDDL